jgi:hypothetical protein
MENPFTKITFDGKKEEDELCALLDQVDTEAMLSAMVAQLLMGSPQQMIGDKHGNHPALLEIVAFYAIPRFGANTGYSISHSDFNRCYK